MAMKTIDNRIRLWALLDDDDRLGKAVGLQRRLQRRFSGGATLFGL